MQARQICSQKIQLKQDPPVCDNPTAKNIPHEEEYDNNNYESIDETAPYK